MPDSGSLECKKKQTKKFYNYRTPKGSGSVFILILNLLVFSYQQGASYDLVSVISDTNTGKNLDPWIVAFLSAIIVDCVPKLLYPLAGWLADAKYGRYKIIRVGLLIMCIAAFLLLMTSIVKYSITDISYTDDDLVYKSIIPVVIAIYVISAIGTACFHVNIIPFGIDQMEDASSEEIISFVYWYYWTRNANFGILIEFAISSTPYYCNASDHVQDSYDLVISLLQIVFLASAFCLDRLWCKPLNVDLKLHNPIKKVKEISKYILKNARQIGYRKAITYTYDTPPTRSDFAKDTYGGKFSEDDVEDVTAFWRIVAFLMAIGCSVFLLHSGKFSYPLYFDHLKEQNVDVACSDKYIVTTVVSVMTITICIPVFEFIIYPFVGHYIPRITRRIGLGIIVMLIGHCSLFTLDFTAHKLGSNEPNIYNSCMFNNNDMDHLNFSPYYLVPIIFIMSIGELLVVIALLEFLCAQSPYHMRGLLIGIFYFLDGIFTALMGLVLLIFSVSFKYVSASHLYLSCGSSYTVCVLTTGVFGFAMYVYVAKWYRKRQRGGQVSVNPQTALEDYFEQQCYTSKRLIYLQ